MTSSLEGKVGLPRISLVTSLILVFVCLFSVFEFQLLFSCLTNQGTSELACFLPLWLPGKLLLVASAISNHVH